MQEFRDASGVKVEVSDGDNVGKDSQVEALGKRTAELEEENRELRELVEAQSVQLEERCRARYLRLEDRRAARREMQSRLALTRWMGSEPPFQAWG